MNEKEFSPNQNRALLALLKFGSTRVASKDTGISEPQLYRYSIQPAFKKKLREMRRAQFEEVATTMQRFSTTAVATIVDVMQDRHAPHMARLNAAKTILELGHHGIELEALQAEIEELHARLDAPAALNQQPLRLLK